MVTQTTTAQGNQQQENKLLGMKVRVIKHDGSYIDTHIKHTTDKAIMFKAIDGQKDIGGRVAWIPKSVWVKEYYYSGVLKIMTIAIPRGIALIWKDPSQK